jgi:hypothetical protein|tara:strand:- start:736 stop:1962 length:1227 start_codon:yes stop_codon:yes gene_type:complete
MGNLFNSLNKLKSNIFGGPGNTGFTKPPATRVAKLGLKDTPTSLLDVDPTAFASYSYPRDVTNNVQNGHYMLFYINVQNRSKFEYQNPEGGKLTTVTKVSKKKWKAEGGKVIGYDAREKKNITEGTYYNEVKDVKGEHKGEVEYYRKRAGAPSVSQFEDGSRNRNNRGGIAGKAPTTTRISDSVAIYLPPNVQDSLGATYNDTETGMLGFAAAAGLDFSNAVGAKDYEAAANALVGGAAGVLTEGAKKAGAALAETLAGAEGAAGMVNRVFGQADNPYVEVLFQAMEVRTFTYNFTFAPRSEEETKDVQEIIQLFRFHMVPELQGGQSRFLTLPSEFDIHYMYIGKDGTNTENEYYNKIATCVCTNVTVDYTPGKVSSFTDGAPTQITMALTFKETETLTKDKVNAGY